MLGNNFKNFLLENDLKASSYCFKNGSMTPETFKKAYGFDLIQYPQSFKMKKGKVVVTPEFIKKCNYDLFEAETEEVTEAPEEDSDISKVKEKLPMVKVRFEGKVQPGYMRTGDTEYAYVHLKTLPGTKFQYTWDQIVDAVKNGTVLETT